MMNRNKLIKNGFTLIEMLISVAIVTIGVFGVFSSVSKYALQTQQSKEGLIAAYLGQEAIEIVKNIRDTNWIEGDVGGWGSGLNPGNYETDINPGTTLLPYAASDYLYIEGTTGFYKYIGSPLAGDIKTPYQRRITITDVSVDEKKVVVEVMWTGNTMSIEEHIFNWKI